ncbi:MAG TPA: hypothetical protein VHJ17_02420 [Thermomonospora sp.]|nr:hypothetical protein [Thermomonospora sp.]
MGERDSGWVDGVVDAEDARLATGLLAGPGDGPLLCRTGIRPAPDEPGLVEPLETPAGGVTVRPFQAVVQGTRGVAAGAYLVTLDQRKTVPVPPGHPSHPRLDLIVARQRDRQYGDATTAFTVECVSGTAAPSPAEPAVDGDHLVLALVRVPAGTSAITQANLTDRRAYTTALGGVLPVAAHETPPGRGYPGQRLYDLETHQDLVWEGEWRPAMAGLVTAYGPADPDWPKFGSTVDTQEFVVNQLTVPGTPFRRLLHYTATALVRTTVPEDRFDWLVRVNGDRRKVFAFHGGPTNCVTVIATGQVNQAAGSGPVVFRAALWRAAGRGSAALDATSAEYTALHVLALPRAS